MSIAALPLRIIKDTRGIVVEYDYEMTDPHGRVFSSRQKNFVSGPDGPVSFISFRPIARLMEIYREQEKALAAVEKEREAWAAEKGALEKDIRSLQAKVAHLEMRKKG